MTITILSSSFPRSRIVSFGANALALILSMTCIVRSKSILLNSGASDCKNSSNYLVSAGFLSTLPRLTISKIGVFFVLGNVTFMNYEISSIISSGKSTFSNSLKLLAFEILLATRYSREFNIRCLVFGSFKSFMFIPPAMFRENCWLSGSDCIRKIVSPLWCL